MSYIPNPLIVPIGMLVGVLLALPVGPANMLALQRAVERGFFGGLAAGIGIMLGDGLIALGAAMGVHALSGAIRDYREPIQLIGGMALAFAGLKLIYTRPQLTTQPEAGPRSLRDYVWSIPELFLLTITNPGAVLGLIAIYGGVSSFVEIEGYLDALTMVAAIMAGNFCYWVVASRAVSSIRHRVTNRMLARINWWSGLALVAFGSVLIGEVALKHYDVQLI